MKKILMVILSLVLGLFAFTACGGNDSSSSPDLKVKYDITYYAVIDGGNAVAVPQEAYAENGKYPTKYTEGETVTVDNLNHSYEITSASATTTVVFGGWFLDDDCTQAFTGIKASMKGNVTLYAKLTTVTEENYQERTISYQAVIGGALNEIPEEMFKSNGKYPTKYIEGGVLTIDDLKEEYQSFNANGSGNEYHFLGWFVDQACTQAFTGITTETRGDIALYAKITYAFWSPSV